MSFYDPTLTREYNPMYRITGESPVTPTGKYDFQFKRKGDDWQYDGEEFSLWGDPAIDPKWVKRIQVLDPELVPIWVKVAFRSPTGGVDVFTRHGLARCLRNPHRWDEPMRQVLMPTSKLPWKVPGKPNIIVSIFRDPSDPDIVPGLPMKPYVPFSKQVYDEVKYSVDSERSAAFAEQDVEQWKRDEADRDRIKLDKAGDEADYRFNHDNKNTDLYSLLRDMPARELEEATARL